MGEDRAGDDLGGCVIASHRIDRDPCALGLVLHDRAFSSKVRWAWPFEELRLAAPACFVDGIQGCGRAPCMIQFACYGQEMRRLWQGSDGGQQRQPRNE